MLKDGALQFAIDKLTKKDIQLIQLLADDHSRQEISEKLDYTLRTVEQKILALRNAFQCNNVVALVALFFRNKLVK